MKKSSLTLLLLCAGLFLQSQTLLNGAVTEQHSGKAIAGVEIRAFDGGVDRSDRKGRFQIGFKDKQSGDAVQILVSDTKGERLVVNQKELDRFIIPADAEDLIQVVMVDQAQFQVAQARYYDIIFPFVKTSAKREQDSLFAQLKRTRDEETTTLLTDKLSELRTDSISLSEQVESLAEYLARIDLNQASRLQKDVLALIDAGNIDLALLQLDDVKLKSMYASAKERLDKARQGILDVITGYELKAELLQGQFKYLDAAVCWERIVEIREAEMPEDIEGLAIALEEIGFVLLDAGKYKEAQTYMLRSCQSLESRECENDTSLASSYNNLGVAFTELGEYERAEGCFQKAISINETMLDSFHPQLATSYANLGQLYSRLGQMVQAEHYALKSLLIRETVLDSLNLDLATSYSNLGVLCIRIGQFENAELYSIKALSIRKKALDSLHHFLGTSYNNLGVLYDYMGQFKQAEYYALKALSIDELVLDSLHPSLAINYNNLGTLYSGMGQYNQAKRYFLKSMAIRETVMDSFHTDLAWSYNNLGVVYSWMDDWSNGLLYSKKAAYIWERNLGHSHIQLGAVYDLLSHFYEAKGELPSALTYLHKADTVFQFESNSKHPRRIPHEQTWARYYALTAQPDSALQKLRLAIELGFDDDAWLEQEKDLDSLRELPEFQAMVNELKIKNE